MAIRQNVAYRDNDNVNSVTENAVYLRNYIRIIVWHDGHAGWLDVMRLVGETSDYRSVNIINSTNFA